MTTTMNPIAPHPAPIASGRPKRRARKPRTWLEILVDETGAAPASCVHCGMIVRVRNWGTGYGGLRLDADVMPVRKDWLLKLPEAILWDWHAAQGYSRYHEATQIHHLCPPEATGRLVEDG